MNIADPAGANACMVNIAKLSAACTCMQAVNIADAAGCMQDGHSEKFAGQWT